MASVEKMKKEIETIVNNYEYQCKTGDDCLNYSLSVIRKLISETNKPLKISKMQNK